MFFSFKLLATPILLAPLTKVRKVKGGAALREEDNEFYTLSLRYLWHIHLEICS